jgi:NAD(P)-dependent dehydrogenase (short-subunit alcohol dehydrogenase family)
VGKPLGSVYQRGRMRTVLITGCSSGIGADLALGLRDRGWRVFASCRKLPDCLSLRDKGFESPCIDYTNSDSIAAGLDNVIKATGGTLDAVVHNGAFAMLGAVEDVPPEALRACLETNVIGWHDLTTRVLPIMRAQGHGRIVYVSSVLGMVPAPWRGAYVASKFALEGLVHTLRLEMRDTPIKIVTVAPGPITSKIRQNAIPHFERWVKWRESARVVQYEKRLLKRLYEDTGPDRFELSPRSVTRQIVHALEAERPRARYHVTVPTHMMAVARRILPVRALDWLLSKA